MRQKEVLQKISKEIRDLHNIAIEKHTFHRHGDHDAYMGFPTSLIESIEEGTITISIRVKSGILTLWKNHSSAHLALFDRKAMNRRLARKRKKEKEVNKVGPMPRKLPEQSDTSMLDLPGTG